MTETQPTDGGRTETQRGAARVEVELTDCPAADARAVLGLLARAFPGEEAGSAPDTHCAEGSDRPQVWTATLDAADGRSGEGDGRQPPAQQLDLTGPVTAELRGAPAAVQRVRTALSCCCHTDDLGHASGDQEVEVRLLLTH